MAKLDLCTKTVKLSEMMYDGRGAEAKRKTVELLRDGYAAKPFLAFVAEMLDPPKRGRGGPKRPPKNWLDIGARFEQLYDDGRGLTFQEAILQLEDEFPQRASTIETAVGIYRAARDTPE